MCKVICHKRRVHFTAQHLVAEGSHIPFLEKMESIEAAENKMNVEEDLTPEQITGLTVHYVKTIDEALRVSLPAVVESASAKLLTTTTPAAAHDKAFAQA